MPDGHGDSLCQWIRRNWKELPVIFLTADALAETEIKCFQMGAMDFVTKPFVPDILLSRVSKTIELDQYRHNLENMVNDQAQKIMEGSMRLGRIQESVIIGMANLIESRDGSTGGFFADNIQAGQQVWNTVNLLLRLDRDWKV